MQNNFLHRWVGWTSLIIALIPAGCRQAPRQEAWMTGGNPLVHTPPAWLHQQPFVQARGSWEPLTFIVRRGHGSSFLRDLQMRRGYAEPTLRENWLALSNEQSIDHEIRAGSTYWTTQLFKGFGLEAEGEDRSFVKELVPRLQSKGFRVGGYIGGTIGYETFLLERPEAEEWFVPLDYWGEAATYSSQYFRRRIWFHHPGYKEYIKQVLRLGVQEYGLDLIHFDNIGNVGKIAVFSHPMAVQAFRDYLRQKYPAERLKQRLGFSDPRYVLPPVAPALEKQEIFYDPLVMEWIDFRCAALASYIKEMTDYVRSLNPQVATDINIGTLTGSNEAWSSSVDLSLLLPNTDVYIVEGNNGGRYTADERLVSNIRDYKIGRTFSNLVLNRMGSPGGIDYTPVTVPEQLAFNQTCLGPASMNHDNWKYIDFLKRNFEYYKGTTNIADVAILRSYPSMAYNNFSTHESTILFEQALIQGNIPFDIIFDRHLESLSKYRVLILANQESLSEQALRLITGYVRGGGGLVATGLTSLFDEWRERRPDFGLRELFQVAAPLPAARGEIPVLDREVEKRNLFGEGRVVYVSGVEPAIERPPLASVTNRYWKLPKNWKQLKEAVRWAAGGELSLEIDAPLYVVSEILRQEERNRILVHLVNFAVVRDPEVENIRVDLLVRGRSAVTSVTLLSPYEAGSRNVTFQSEGGRLKFTIPSLQAYALAIVQ